MTQGWSWQVAHLAMVSWWNDVGAAGISLMLGAGSTEGRGCPYCSEPTLLLSLPLCTKATRIKSLQVKLEDDTGVGGRAGGKTRPGEHHGQRGRERSVQSWGAKPAAQASCRSAPSGGCSAPLGHGAVMRASAAMGQVAWEVTGRAETPGEPGLGGGDGDRCLLNLDPTDEKKKKKGRLQI